MGVFSKITGESGKGPIRTYIHKASNTGPDLNLTDANRFFFKGVPLDGDTICPSRNGREQKQESDTYQRDLILLTLNYCS